MRAKLGDIFEISSGGTPSKSHPEYYGGDIPWVKTGDLKKEYLYEVEDFITEEGLKNSSAKMYESDTVLIAMYGATIGATSILKMNACTNQACAAFKKNEQVIPEYLYYFLRSQKDKFVKDGVGGAQPNISARYLKKVEMELPSIDEQRIIVNILDKISNIIVNRNQEMISLDDLIKARFVEMFGDPKINPNHYLMSQLSKYITFLTSGSRGWAKYCTDDGSEWFITIKNVKDCHILVDNMQPVNAPDNAEAKRTKVQKGDLLISITADLGRTGVVTGEIAEHGAYINQHLTCIRLNQTVLNPLYVSYFMESPAGKEQFESKNQSAVKAGLNFNSINSLLIMVPPIELQNQFADFVQAIDKSKDSVQKALDEAQLLFDSLMQQYFG